MSHSFSNVYLKGILSDSYKILQDKHFCQVEFCCVRSYKQKLYLVRSAKTDFLLCKMLSDLINNFHGRLLSYKVT